VTRNSGCVQEPAQPPYAMVDFPTSRLIFSEAAQPLAATTACRWRPGSRLFSSYPAGGARLPRQGSASEPRAVATPWSRVSRAPVEDLALGFTGVESPSWPAPGHAQTRKSPRSVVTTG
jgi:hypothetical protein